MVLHSCGSISLCRYSLADCVLNLVNTNQSTTSRTSSIYSLVYRHIESIRDFFPDIFQLEGCIELLNSSWSITMRTLQFPWRLLLSYHFQSSERSLVIQIDLVCIGNCLPYSNSSDYYEWYATVIHWYLAKHLQINTWRLWSGSIKD